VAIRNNHLFQIEMRNGEPILAHDYLHKLEEMYDHQKNEIQEIQKPSFDVLEQYVVTSSLGSPNKSIHIHHGWMFIKSIR